MSVLNDLFVQIVQSEERIRERFSILRKDPINSLLRLSCYILLVNGEIQDFQRKFQDLAEELKSLQGLVVLKNQHLAEKELDLRWFGIRGVVSSKKRQELSATAEHLRQKKEETERAIGIEKKNFARDVTQFISLLESDDRAKGNQFLEATMQMEEFNCKEQRFYQGS
ncbi:uncharacterized protein [Pocillopora verrucosa]|uniref:uncharacterized protein isoform X1 n=1 Tax=Pocillopora verrucosa TaxID=203993 RepID=UPI0033420A2E